MIDLPLNKKYILPPLTLSVLSFLFALFALNPVLEFDRSLITQGQFWRLLTGQLVHSNWYHLLLNCGGILLIWALHAEHTSPRRYLFNVIFLGLFCGIGLYLFYPETHIYTGLSGLLHGVIIFGALKDIQVGMKSGYVLFLGVWLKVLWEQYNGPNADVGILIDARVAIEAHLLGAIGGSVFILENLKHKLKS
ncbi:rhombosortase [Pseudoalteromonas denitrificans]|uniref:Rhomboid family GlyGly-CTERM serine protease n=1 Tax=Pseudoalteromonas denitrificans DSM 6059 TaxID=1123010 RepID=A0A1I1QDS7_9GAMM|nr:rhombosortase [Pseudoalteromonas denitrificans]SFD20256.1 rhomboid family GlyGly-CTERM serine protease [Pseudoalteromonas denitrificans DSM 6059]